MLVFRLLRLLRILLAEPLARRSDMSRAKCTLSEAMCVVLLKAHVSGLEDGAYLTDDPEALLVRYAGFLAAAARQTNRLKASVVEKAAASVFGVPGGSAHKFGQSMSAALAYAYNKGVKATSGRKLSDGVKTVCLGFRSETMQPLQSALASPVRAGAPSAGPSGSGAPESEAVVFVPQAGLAAASSAETPSEIAKLYGLSPLQEAAPEKALEIFSSQEVLSQEFPVQSKLEAEMSEALSTSASKRRRIRQNGALAEPILPPPLPVRQGSLSALDEEIPAASSGRAEWFDLHQHMHYVLNPDGSVSSAKLEAGPTGFARAIHQGREVTTEIPNLTLALAEAVDAAADGKRAGGPKRRAASKRQAAQSARPMPAVVLGAPANDGVPPSTSAALVPAEAPAQDPAEAPADYQCLYYKLTNMVGIREKRGAKRQVFSLGGKRCGKGRDELLAIGREVAGRLARGELSIEAARDWARGRARQE